MADADERDTTQSTLAASQAMQEEVAAISGRVQRLNRLYFDEDIEREVYLAEKADLFSRKKSLDEKIADLQRGNIAWLEPLRGWIKDALLVGESAASPSLSDKKSSALKISGSNLFLKNRRIEFNPTPPYASLREARKNFGENNYVSLMSG
jgi:hypothetical protein